MLFFIFSLLPIFAFSQTFQYCDDCLLSCCNIYNTCASSTRTCYCTERLCKNNCCIDSRCGTADECSQDKIASIIISVTVIVCSIFCILLIIFIIRIRKNQRRLRVANYNNDQAVLNPIMNRPSQRAEPPPINQVYIGTPLNFNDYGKEMLPGSIPVMMGLKVDKKEKKNQVFA